MLIRELFRCYGRLLEARPDVVAAARGINAQHDCKASEDGGGTREAADCLAEAIRTYLRALAPFRWVFVRRFAW